MYHWCFQIKADEFGVFIGFVYIICAASRLARFNISEENLSSFQGLPSPAAAAMVGSIVFSFPLIEQGAVIIAAGTILMLFIAYLMVSNIEFLSVKKLQIANMRTFGIIFLGMVIAFAWYSPKTALLTITSLYCLSGYLLKIGFVKKLLLGKKEIRKAANT